MKANELLTTWPKFLPSSKLTVALYLDYYGNFPNLTLAITVAKFQPAFKDLMNKVVGISKPLLASFFITNLM